MSDFDKLVNHPEFETIVDKLINDGDTAKNVSQYLKLKYAKPDESHLRLSASLLEEFQKKYVNQYDEMIKEAEKESLNKLDKKVSQALLNTRTYSQRLEEIQEEKLDVTKKLIQFQTILEHRLEQVFDKIQENPGGSKLDYVLIKYFEVGKQYLEAIDKVVNGGSSKVENHYTIQMVEEHTVALQQAIRRTLEQMGPEQASLFLELLNEEMKKVKHPSDAFDQKSQKMSSAAIDKLFEEASTIDAEVEEIYEEEDGN